MVILPECIHSLIKIKFFNAKYCFKCTISQNNNNNNNRTHYYFFIKMPNLLLPFLNTKNTGLMLSLINLGLLREAQPKLGYKNGNLVQFS